MQKYSAEIESGITNENENNRRYVKDIDDINLMHTKKRSIE